MSEVCGQCERREPDGTIYRLVPPEWDANGEKRPYKAPPPFHWDDEGRPANSYICGACLALVPEGERLKSVEWDPLRVRDIPVFYCNIGEGFFLLRGVMEEVLPHALGKIKEYALQYGR